MSALTDSHLLSGMEYVESLFKESYASKRPFDALVGAHRREDLLPASLTLEPAQINAFSAFESAAQSHLKRNDEILFQARPFSPGRPASRAGLTVSSFQPFA